MPGPNGTIVHAEIKIGDSPIMLADEMPGMEFKSPSSIGGSPVGILVYVEEWMRARPRQLPPELRSSSRCRTNSTATGPGRLWTPSGIFGPSRPMLGRLAAGVAAAHGRDEALRGELKGNAPELFPGKSRRRQMSSAAKAQPCRGS